MTAFSLYTAPMDRHGSDLKQDSRNEQDTDAKPF